MAVRMAVDWGWDSFWAFYERSAMLNKAHAETVLAEVDVADYLMGVTAIKQAECLKYAPEQVIKAHAHILKDEAKIALGLQKPHQKPKYNLKKYNTLAG